MSVDRIAPFTKLRREPPSLRAETSHTLRPSASAFNKLAAIYRTLGFE